LCPGRPFSDYLGLRHEIFIIYKTFWVYNIVNGFTLEIMKDLKYD
jgi:hypothetical protein